MSVQWLRAWRGPLLCGFALLGCLDETTGIGPPCAVDGDCRGNRTCEEGLCVLDNVASTGGSAGDGGTGGEADSGGGGDTGSSTGSGGSAASGGDSGTGATGGGGSGGAETTTSGGGTTTSTGGATGGAPSCSEDGDDCNSSDCCEGLVCLSEAGAEDFSCYAECSQHSECSSFCCVIYEDENAACLAPEVCECGGEVTPEACGSCKDSMCCLEANRCLFDLECALHFNCLADYCLSSSEEDCEATYCSETLAASSTANALIDCLADNCALACGFTQ